MACDYNAIRHENERRYGTDIGRIGPMLLADRYDDRTHFIFELLQNAEDALSRRAEWEGSRAVSFDLTNNGLRVSHFGRPFDERDVRGICGIAESTKDITAIGRFGIGFKSVYAFTDRPEIHSGDEAFAIEKFVWPVAARKEVHDTEETVISIPLKANDATGHDEMACGLGQLGATALLFLREIEEIRWSVDGDRSGHYIRASKEIAVGVRRVTVIGQEEAQPAFHETWLLFNRGEPATNWQPAAHVELAFLITFDERSQRERIQRVERSPLVVFFPTILETHLGFLIQGAYRTTPSRDNVPRADAWNQLLVRETALLLREALFWLRDNKLLDGQALRCLPLDSGRFGDDTMFAPLFSATKSVLLSESLLPRFDDGHVAAVDARLGRTQEIRDLLTPMQLTELYGGEGHVAWISGDITHDRMPEVRRYLIQELDVAELAPQDVIGLLTPSFLVAQSDIWIERLYAFLNDQPALRRHLDDLPLIRLEDGTHVLSHADGQPQAFLPGKIATGFPIVRGTVCGRETALHFLRSLGLTEPDPVDDVVRNVLPKYRQHVSMSKAEYEADIGRILNAFSTDSKAQREKLLGTLRETAFVMAVNMGDESEQMARPGQLYIATERLKELFASVANVLLVDGRYSCLRGEGIRELLEACGAVRYLRPIGGIGLSWQEREALRVQAGHAETSGFKDHVTDWTLLGLEGLLKSLSGFTLQVRRTKAGLLWEELDHLEERRGKDIFDGEYSWSHYGGYRRRFDSTFVRVLNTTAWIADGDGNLQVPDAILFGSLGWKANPFLLAKVRFRPAIIDQLAKEAGIEPGVLDLLKQLGVTSESELRARLGVADEIVPDVTSGEGDVENGAKTSDGDTLNDETSVPHRDDQDPLVSAVDGGDDGDANGGGADSGQDHTRSEGTGGDKEANDREAGAKRAPDGTGKRPFVSYVAAHSETEAPDPDGLDHLARMTLERKAIDLIISKEPTWRRTPANNPGFDLYQGEALGAATRLCEVKAMTGSLDDRSVGMSRTQFECARDRGENYWLYIVEHAGSEVPRIVRIQDPAGKSQSFTFDHGWRSIAEER